MEEENISHPSSEAGDIVSDRNCHSEEKELTPISSLIGESKSITNGLGVGMNHTLRNLGG
jgi:hypothetical protein